MATTIIPSSAPQRSAMCPLTTASASELIAFTDADIGSPGGLGSCTIDYAGNGVTRIDPTIDFTGATRVRPPPGIFRTRLDPRKLAGPNSSCKLYRTIHVLPHFGHGARLWINGQPVIDSWVYQDGSQVHTATITLQANQWYSIRVDYFQGGWGEKVKLRWSYNGSDAQTFPRTTSVVRIWSRPPYRPTNNVPSDQSIGVNSPLYFSSATQNAITVDDAEAEANAASVPIVNGSFETGLGFNLNDPTDLGWNFTPDNGTTIHARAAS